MLKEIAIENFKSINDEQLFSMEACPKNQISEFPNHVVTIGDQEILKVSSVYGPNGGGKTTLLDAIKYVKNIAFGNPIIIFTPDENTYIDSLINDNKESVFKIFFAHKQFEIGYIVKVDLSKSHPNSIYRLNNDTKEIIPDIKEEVLIKREYNSKEFEIVYQRGNDGIVISDSLNQLDFVNKKQTLASNISFMSYILRTFGNNRSQEYLFPIYYLGDELGSIKILNRMVANYIYTEEEVKQISIYLNKVTECLKIVDLNIDNLYFDLSKNLRNVYELFITRKVGNKSFTLPISSESNGTKKFIALLFDIYRFDSDGIYIADDFDACLHPKLVRCIIDLFNHVENNTKQLIFNSHDITNMNNQVFRRDEIWFAFRDDSYSSIYQPLSNIVNYKGEQIRKDAKFGKQYLEGRYGADPYISRGLSWEIK